MTAPPTNHDGAGYSLPAQSGIRAQAESITRIRYQTTKEWIHSISTILSALMEAGLTITMLREHETLPWNHLPCLARASEGLWRLPEGLPRFPLSLSLRARKGETARSPA